MIHQCHRCELRFVTEAELTEHLGHDHRVDVTVFERYRYPAGRETLAPLYADMAGGPPRRRYLVVANLTLEGAGLREHLRACAEAQPSAFHVVVPATHSADYPDAPKGATDPDRPPIHQGSPDEEGLAQAHWRLRRALDELRGLGAIASGEVGPPDPLAAVAEPLGEHPVDEVIVSTLPAGVSRWLKIDLPREIERRWGVPVSTVVVSQAQLRPRSVS